MVHVVVCFCIKATATTERKTNKKVARQNLICCASETAMQDLGVLAQEQQASTHAKLTQQRHGRKREREMATRVRGLSRLQMKGGESSCTGWDMGGLPPLTFKPSVDATALPFRFPNDRVVQTFDKLKRRLLQPHSSGTVESDSSRSCDCHPRRHGAPHVLSCGSAGAFAAHPCWPQQLFSQCMWMMDGAARAIERVWWLILSQTAQTFAIFS